MLSLEERSGSARLRHPFYASCLDAVTQTRPLWLIQRTRLCSLGVSGDRVREVFGERGHDIDADFETAHEFAGAAFMRQKMSHILCSLELVYYETKIGRQLTEDERLER